MKTFTTNNRLRKALTSVFMLAGVFMGNAQIVFPDANFKNALLNHSPAIDTNGDGEISTGEASLFNGTMNVSNKSISDLTGIVYFYNLTGLNCSNNNLTSLNLFGNIHLKEVWCNSNQLTSLEISSCTELEFLQCSTNNLTNLDTMTNDNLKPLWASNNNFTSIDVSENLLLESLSVQNNNLTGELNLNVNTALKYLQCFDNNLTSVVAQSLAL